MLGLPALFVPHSASLSPATATGVLSTLVPLSDPPTGLDECLFFISLVWTFLPFDSPSVLVVRGSRHLGSLLGSFPFSSLTPQLLPFDTARKTTHGQLLEAGK